MEIIEKDINYYIKRLQNNEYFSFPGYSDAEWLAMSKQRIGEKTAAGQIWTKEIGDRLIDSLVKNRHEKSFLPAFPKIMNGWGMMKDVKEILYRYGLTEMDFYERDIVTDDLAAQPGGLQPLIKQLRKMDVYLVGNVLMQGLRFLNYKKHFITESLYNFHIEGDIDAMVEEIADFGKPGVYLFSVGMSDAVMIGELHNRMKNAFLIDCGSIWDAFYGNGANRGWREELYKDPVKWSEWITKNLTDV